MLIILRPFYLQELSSVIRHGHAAFQAQDSLAAAVKRECLQAARNNCKILVDLYDRGRIGELTNNTCRFHLLTSEIANYGYWDSVHIFYSLAVLALAKVMTFGAKTNAADIGDDIQTQSRCRDLLHKMAQSGNPAANDHEALLADVELMVWSLSANAYEINADFNIDEGQWGMQFDLSGFSDDQLYYEMDWVHLLSLYSQEA